MSVEFSSMVQLRSKVRTKSRVVRRLVSTTPLCDDRMLRKIWTLPVLANYFVVHSVLT